MSHSAAHASEPWSAPGWRHGLLLTRPQPSIAAGRGLVLKIGGSLLSRSDWPRLVTALVAAAPQPARTLVVGGGAVVDGLRSIDAAAPQPPAVMHHLAIEAMRLTARLVATVIGLPLSDAPAAERGAVVLDVPAWLAAAPLDHNLPEGWQVTSDSIAAVVAAASSGNLLLAKSAAPPRPVAHADDLAALAATGWLDDHFPVAAAGVAAIAWAAPA